MRLLTCSCRLSRLSRLLPLLLAVAARSIASGGGVASAHPSAPTPTLAARDLAALDAQFAASLQQVTSEQQALAERLDASRRLVEEMFASEQEETLAFMRETRAKMLSIRQSLREEMRAALAEVQTLLAGAAANATTMIEQHNQVKATPAGPFPAKNQTCELQTGQDDDLGDEIATTKQPSEPLISWDAVQEAAARVVVGLARYYELFAVALVHYVAVVGLWVLLPAAAIVAVFVLAAVAIAKLQAYQRARRRPRVVYSGYLRSHRQPNCRLETEARNARTKNGSSREARRLANGGP